MRDGTSRPAPSHPAGLVPVCLLLLFILALPSLPTSVMFGGLTTASVREAGPGEVPVPTPLSLPAAPASTVRAGNEVPVVSQVPSALPPPTAEVPIILSNAQSSPIGDYQQKVDVASSTYSTYINANWSNVWFTYTSGTTITAWIETNASNTAAQTIVWLKLNGIGASGSVTVDMVFGPTSYHGLSASGPTGEAPQLSSTYGQLDDGALVFPFYDNFKGTTLNANLWKAPVKTANGAVTVNNGVSFYAKGNGDYVFILTKNALAPPLITEELFDPNGLSTAGINPVIGETTAGTKSTLVDLCPGYEAQWVTATASSTNYFVDPNCTTSTSIASGWPIPTTSTVVGTAWVTTGSEWEYQNYSTEEKLTDSSLAITTTYYPYFGLSNYFAGTYYVQWVRARMFPPNGVMPSTTFAPLLTAPGQPTVSATVLDSDQVLSVQDSVPTTGSAPFEYEWLVSVNGGVFGKANVCSIPDGSGVPKGTVETCTVPAGTLISGKSYAFTFAINDSTGSSAVSTPSPNVKVYAPLVPGTITASGTLLDRGQSATLTANPSGGAAPYTYTWYAGSSNTCANDPAAPGPYALTTTVAPAASSDYCFSVQDSATQPENRTTTAVLLTVNPALAANAITPSAPTILQGNGVTLSAQPSGGSPPYSFQWFSGLSSSCASDSPISGATGSMLNVTPATSTYYCYSLSDVSNGTPTATASSPTDLVTIATLPAIPGTPTASRPTVDVGQGVSFVSSGSSSGGSGGNYYSWVGLPPGCPTANSLNITCAPTAAGNFTINVTVTDSQGYSTTSATLNYVVYSDPHVSAPVPSRSSSDVGQSVTFVANGIGGYGSLTYSWTNSSTALGCAPSNNSTLGCDPTRSGTSFTVSVAVTDQNGFVTAFNISSYYLVFPDPLVGSPVPSTTNVVLGLSVYFNSSVVQPGSGGDVYRWTLSGTGLGCAVSTNLTLRCTPGSTGNYTTLITMTDSNGFSNSSISPVVRVTPTTSGPVINSFGASPDPVILGSTTYLNVSSSGGSGTLSYTFTGVPPGCATADVHALPCTPSRTGNFTVEVFVNDTAGHSANATTLLEVVNTTTVPELASVSVSPSSKSLPVLTQVVLQAIPACTGGACPKVGVTYLWTLQSPALGSLSSTSLQSTTFTAGATPGTTRVEVTASYLGKVVHSNATLTITSNVVPTLLSVAISPANASLAPGTAQSFQASAACSPSPCPSGIAYTWRMNVSSLGNMSTSSGSVVRFTAGNHSGNLSLAVTAVLGAQSVSHSIPVIILAGSTAPTGSTGNGFLVDLLLILVLVIALVFLLVLLAWRRSRRASPPTYPAAAAPPPTGMVAGAVVASAPPPPPTQPEWIEDDEPREDSPPPEAPASPSSEVPASEPGAVPEIPPSLSEVPSPDSSPEATDLPPERATTDIRAAPQEGSPSPEEETPAPEPDESEAVSLAHFRNFRKELRRLRKQRTTLGSSVAAGGTARTTSPEEPSPEPHPSDAGEDGGKGKPAQSREEPSTEASEPGSAPSYSSSEEGAPTESTEEEDPSAKS